MTLYPSAGLLLVAGRRTGGDGEYSGDPAVHRSEDTCWFYQLGGGTRAAPQSGCQCVELRTSQVIVGDVVTT